MMAVAQLSSETLVSDKAAILFTDMARMMRGKKRRVRILLKVGFVRRNPTQRRIAIRGQTHSAGLLKITTTLFKLLVSPGASSCMAATRTRADY